jgi:hypothetical protein
VLALEELAANQVLEFPLLLDRRWREIKTSMYKLVQHHSRDDLLQALLQLRESHTTAPTLSEITYFTGYDVAIHTMQRWDWEVQSKNLNLEADAQEIGKYGAELMVVHTIRESIRNELLVWDGQELQETPRGIKHFQTINAFNVEITGSRMDVARKRFSQGRLSKQQRTMDPINKLSSVKRLYWENSILMLLRAPLPFYRAMQILSTKQRDHLIDLHSKIIAKYDKQLSKLITIRIRKDTQVAKVLQKLIPPSDKSDRRPRFVACLSVPDDDQTEKIKYQIGLGALTMFTMFLLGFERENLDEKADRAEKAVCEVIEASGYWTVIESNTEVVHAGGEVVTEIDIIAQSKVEPNRWITFEVKDFSFWRGWIWARGANNRKEYYIKAINKIPVKEEFIRKKHACEDLISIIVTSVPETFDALDDIKIIYLSDLSEELAKMTNHQYTPRKRHTSSNFLIRYFERLQKDYSNADLLQLPIKDLESQVLELKEELIGCKNDYEQVRGTYQMIISEYDTLQVSKKLASKRLVKDSGEKHYQLEEELERIKKMLSKTHREKMLKANILRDLKESYNSVLKKVKSKENEILKEEKSVERLLSARLF